MKPNQMGVVGLSLCALSIGSSAALAGPGSPCPDCVIEVHAIADAVLYAQLGSGTENYIRSVIDGVNAVWSMPVSSGGMGVGVVLSEFTFNEKIDPWELSTDANMLLPNVQSYVSSAYPITAQGRDVVLMFSGLDFDGSTVGLSFVGHLCQPSSVGIVQSDSFSLAAVVYVASHQLGHLAGALHDGVGNACNSSSFIMGSVFNPLDPPSTFSDCTIQYFASLIQNTPLDIPACLAAPAADCPADLTGDGVLDFFDISAFLTAYSTMDPVADFSPDGVFDFFDIAAFINAYSTGCP